MKLEHHKLCIYSPTDPSGHVKSNKTRRELWRHKMLKRHFFSCLGWIIAAIFFVFLRKNRILIQNEFDENSFSHLPFGTCNNIEQQKFLALNDKQQNNGNKFKILIGFDFMTQSGLNEYSRAFVRHYYAKLGKSDARFDLTIRFFSGDSRQRSIFADSVKLRLDRL